ncbi:MAG: Hint domain-containing protein, partial [Pseudomonadota bacterium]
SDGSYNDQIDVSDLRTPDGHPVNAFDVVVTDDGNGNALLTFPEGETLVLQGVSPAQMSSTQQLNAAGIPCFATGTSIATARGPVLVEALRPGDRVQTRDNGLRSVRWIGSRHVTRHDLATNPMLRPIHIAPGTFANSDALRLSAQHALALDTARGVTQLVRAGHLARLHGGAVRVAHGVHRVTYYHLLLDSHDLIMAGGVPCESFYPGPWGLLSVGPRATRDLIRLMPELRRVPVADCYGAPAHPVARFGGLPPDLRDLRAAA